MTSTLGRQSARGAGYTVASQLVKFSAQVATVIVLARLLTPQDYGLMAMAMVVVGIAEVVRDFGLSSAAVQARTLSIAQRNNLFWINLTIGAVLAIVVLSFAQLVAAFYNQPAVGPMVSVLAVVFLINGAATQYRASLNRSLRFKSVAVSDSAAAIASLVVAVVLAVAGAGYWALVAQQIVQSAITLTVLLVAGRWIPGVPRRGCHMRALVTFGANQMAAQFVNYFSRNVDTVIIGARFGVGELGYYSRAYSLVRLPTSQVTSPATSVALPVLSRLQDEPARFNAYLLRGQTVVVLGMSLLMGFLAVQAEPLVQVFLGTQWAPMVTYLAVLAVGGIFQVASSTSMWVITARGHSGSFLRMMLVTRFMMIALIAIGAVWGTLGVAVAYSLSCVLSWLVGVLWAQRVAQAPGGEMIKTVAVATSGSAVCCLASAALSRTLPSDFYLLRVALGFLGLLICAAVLGLCWKAFRVRLIEVFTVLRLMVPSRGQAIPDKPAAQPTPEVVPPWQR